MDERFDVLAFGAHPDDLEVAMGGTAAKLSDKGLTALFVDLCDVNRPDTRAEHLMVRPDARALVVFAAGETHTLGVFGVQLGYRF